MISKSGIREKCFALVVIIILPFKSAIAAIKVSRQPIGLFFKV